MDIARIRLTGPRQLVGVDEAGHTVAMDAKPEYGGENAGIRPVELILHGLGGCTAMDVASILEKKREDFRSIELEVTGVQREEYPRIYTTINIHYRVRGFGVRPESVARAIQLSEEKYCSARGMLGEQVTVTTSYEVVEDRPAGVALLAGE